MQILGRKKFGLVAIYLRMLSESNQENKYSSGNQKNAIHCRDKIKKRKTDTCTTKGQEPRPFPLFIITLFEMIFYTTMDLFVLTAGA